MTQERLSDLMLAAEEGERGKTEDIYSFWILLEKFWS